MRNHKITKVFALLLSFSLLFQQTGLAQVASTIDFSGKLSALRQSFTPEARFRPLHLRYLSYDGLNNNFKLLVDKGSNANFRASDLENASKDLLKYFFIGLALPNDTFWVNLRPDSPDQIIDPALEKTDIGRIFLEADVELKRDTALATSPDTKEGKIYWDKLYQKASELYGTTEVTIPTLTRPWIVPDEVIISESANSAYIYKATLKVMLEEDYFKSSSRALSGYSAYKFDDERAKELNTYSTQLLKELILPKIIQTINTGKKYAALRQVFYSQILSQWFKARQKGLSSKGTVPGLIDSGNLEGLISKEPYSKDTYFKQYQNSFRNGEYKFQAPVSTPTGQVIRSYFSGGLQTSLMPGMPNFGGKATNPKTGGTVVSMPASRIPQTPNVAGIEATVNDKGEAVGVKASSAVSQSAAEKPEVTEIELHGLRRDALMALAEGPTEEERITEDDLLELKNLGIDNLNKLVGGMFDAIAKAHFEAKTIAEKTAALKEGMDKIGVKGPIAAKIRRILIEKYVAGIRSSDSGRTGKEGLKEEPYKETGRGATSTRDRSSASAVKARLAGTVSRPDSNIAGLAKRLLKDPAQVLDELLQDPAGVSRYLLALVKDKRIDKKSRRVAVTVLGSAVYQASYISANDTYGRVIMSARRETVKRFDLGAAYTAGSQQAADALSAIIADETLERDIRNLADVSAGSNIEHLNRYVASLLDVPGAVDKERLELLIKAAQEERFVNIFDLEERVRRDAASAINKLVPQEHLNDFVEVFLNAILEAHLIGLDKGHGYYRGADGKMVSTYTKQEIKDKIRILKARLSELGYFSESLNNDIANAIIREGVAGSPLINASVSGEQTAANGYKIDPVKLERAKQEREKLVSSIKNILAAQGVNLREENVQEFIFNDKDGKPIDTTYDPYRIENDLPIVIALKGEVFENCPLPKKPLMMVFTGKGTVTDKNLIVDTRSGLGLALEGTQLADSMKYKSFWWEIPYNGKKTTFILQDKDNWVAMPVLYGAEDIYKEGYLVGKGGDRITRLGPSMQGEEGSQGELDEAVIFDKYTRGMVVARLLGFAILDGPDMMRKADNRMGIMVKAARETAQKINENAAKLGLKPIDENDMLKATSSNPSSEGGFPHKEWMVTSRGVVQGTVTALRWITNTLHAPPKEYSPETIAFLKNLKIDPRGPSCLIQGFGDVGSGISELLIDDGHFGKAGINVRGISNLFFAIYHPQALSREFLHEAREIVEKDTDGLKVEKLLEMKSLASLAGAKIWIPLPLPSVPEGSTPSEEDLVKIEAERSRVMAKRARIAAAFKEKGIEAVFEATRNNENISDGRIVNELIYQDAAIFMPAAGANVIRDSWQINDIKARIIAEGANNAISKKLEDKVQEAGILYLPGELLNGGGIYTSKEDIRHDKIDQVKAILEDEYYYLIHVTDEIDTLVLQRTAAVLDVWAKDPSKTVIGNVRVLADKGWGIAEQLARSYIDGTNKGLMWTVEADQERSGNRLPERHSLWEVVMQMAGAEVFNMDDYEVYRNSLDVIKRYSAAKEDGRIDNFSIVEVRAALFSLMRGSYYRTFNDSDELARMLISIAGNKNNDELVRKDAMCCLMYSLVWHKKRGDPEVKAAAIRLFEQIRRQYPVDPTPDRLRVWSEVGLFRLCGFDYLVAFKRQLSEEQKARSGQQPAQQGTPSFAASVSDGQARAAIDADVLERQFEDMLKREGLADRSPNASAPRERIRRAMDLIRRGQFKGAEGEIIPAIVGSGHFENYQDAMYQRDTLRGVQYWGGKELFEFATSLLEIVRAADEPTDAEQAAEAAGAEIANKAAFDDRLAAYDAECKALESVPAAKILDAKNRINSAREALWMESKVTWPTLLKNGDILCNLITKEITRYEGVWPRSKDIVVLRPLSLTASQRQQRDTLVKKLRSGDRDVKGRKAALRELKTMVDDWILPKPYKTEDVFQHCHSTYSHSPGNTPAYIAWKGFVLGLKITGIVDHDTLDGIREFKDCAGMLGLRNPTTGYEMRVLAQGTPFESMQTNSPGNIGETYVAFHAVSRFYHQIQEERVIPAKIKRFKKNADHINGLGIIPLKLDYDAHIEPLTEAGNPTEKHLAEAIARLIYKSYERQIKNGDYSEAIDCANRLIKACGGKQIAGEDIEKAKDLTAFTFMMRNQVVTVLKSTEALSPEGEELVSDRELYADAHENNELVYYCYLGGGRGGAEDYTRVISLEEKLEFIRNMKGSLDKAVLDWWLAKENATMLHLWFRYQWSIGADGIALMPNRNSPEEIEAVIKIALECGFVHIANGMDVNTPEMPYTYYDYSCRPDFVKESLYIVDHEKRMWVDQIDESMISSGIEDSLETLFNSTNYPQREEALNLIITAPYQNRVWAQALRDVVDRFGMDHDFAKQALRAFDSAVQEGNKYAISVKNKWRAYPAKAGEAAGQQAAPANLPRGMSAMSADDPDGKRYSDPEAGTAAQQPKPEVSSAERFKENPPIIKIFPEEAGIALVVSDKMFGPSGESVLSFDRVEGRINRVEDNGNETPISSADVLKSDKAELEANFKKENPGRQVLAVLPNGNLGSNDWFAGIVNGRVYNYSKDPIVGRSYDMLTVTPGGRSQARTVKFFDGKGKRGIFDEHGRDISGEIAYGVYGQRIVKNGRVNVRELAEQFDDLRHLFRLPIFQVGQRQIMLGVSDSKGEFYYERAEVAKALQGRPVELSLEPLRRVNISNAEIVRVYGEWGYKKAAWFKGADSLAPGEYTLDEDGDMMTIRLLPGTHPHSFFGMTESGSILAGAVPGNTNFEGASLTVLAEELIRKGAKDVFLWGNGRDVNVSLGNETVAAKGAAEKASSVIIVSVPAENAASVEAVLDSGDTVPISRPLAGSDPAAAPGGIDFRAMPIVTRAMSNLSVSGSGISAAQLKNMDLDKEWADIERMVSSGIAPSGERIKEYLQAASVKGELGDDVDKVLACISQVLRDDEDRCSASDETLKDILIVLGASRSAEELEELFKEAA